MKRYIFVTLQCILNFGFISDIIMASNNENLNQNFDDKFNLLNHSLFENVIPVYKYKCLRTGITIVFGDIDGPLVNGYFTLATEAHDNDGIPHTLEHLIFLGSEEYPYKGVLDLVANRCLASGINAWTDVDNTCYTVSTAGSEGFLSFLPIYLDHILYPTLTDAGFVTEVHHITAEGEDAGVVYCEMQERENTAESIIKRSLFKKLYPGECGYKSETRGIMKNLRESTTIEKIRKYHNAYYRPENLLLLVTGKVNHSSLFNSLEPVIQKILSKGSRGEYVKPWQNTVDPLTESSNYVELFPCDEETNGVINVGWRVPVGSNHKYKYFACVTLLYYLTDTPISALPKEFVEISDPLCSLVSYSINQHLSIVLEFENVPIQKLKEELIPLKLNEVFNKLNSDDGYFNLEKLRLCIKKYKLSILSKLETHSSSTLASLVIGDFLYGKSQTDLDEGLNTIRMLKKLLREDISFWKQIVRDYFINNHKVIVRGIPSIKKQQELANEEMQRISKRKKDLGDVGLTLKAIELLIAKTECEKKPPSEMLTSIKIPNVELLNLLTYDTFTSNSINQHNIFKTSEVPLFVEIDNVKSNFIYMNALINTKDLELNLRKYLPLFLDLITQSTIIRNGVRLDHMDVIAKLEKDAVSWNTSVGIGPISRFSCGTFSSVVLLSLYVEPEKYHKSINWLHDFLYNTVITKEKFSFNLSKIINEVAYYRSHGCHVLNDIYRNIISKQDSNNYAFNISRQYKFLTSLQKTIETEEGWEVVNKDLNKLKLFLANPDNIKLHITGNLDKLCDIIPEASVALQKIIPNNLKTSVHPFKTQSDFDSILPLSQCGIRACIVGMDFIKSSYFIQVSDSISDYNHPDIAALYVLLQYFSQFKGPIFKENQESGYAYVCGIYLNISEGKICLHLSESVNVPAAYQATKSIIDKHLSTGFSWDQTLFESAKCSVTFDIIKSTMSTLSSQSILLHFRNLKQTYYQELVKKISLVKLEDLSEIGRKYVIPLFNPQSSITVMVCPTIKIEETANEFEKIGIKMNIYKSLDESFLNN